MSLRPAMRWIFSIELLALLGWLSFRKNLFLESRIWIVGGVVL
jgi:hypothetical protein